MAASGPKRRGRALAAGAAAVAILAAAVAVFAALGGDDNQRPTLATGAQSPPVTATATTTLPPFTSTVAEAVVPQVAVFDAPEARAPSRTLTNPTETPAPLVFLVDQQRPDGWLQVLLPVRPNGSTGWIRAADVRLTQTRYHITVELAAFRITVSDGEQIVLQEPVGLGKQDTPTPGGRYYIKELLQPPDPTTVYGPYAYGLSGFSNVFTEFNGGEGVIGIHGNNDPSSLGREASAGCIRMSNDGITRLSKILPLGTPVEILP
ncbi:MAG: L,D-transpeptidase [Acidimicrobiia bacterium]